MAVGEADFDVVIVGGAAIGLACALALRGSGLRVALCDRAVVRMQEAGPEWDPRVFAISPGSAAFLHALGAWQRMPCERLQALETMRVFGDDGVAALNFAAYELGERALAWIVENRTLQNALVEALQCAAGSDDWLHVCAPVEPRSFSMTDDGITLALGDGGVLRARLAIGADGAGSWLRHAASIAGEPRPYGHSGVVANFASDRAHHGRAWQWFLADDGVLACLPLPGPRISMVLCCMV